MERLREVIASRWNAFRRGLRRGDPPARAEPLRVTLKPRAPPVKPRPSVFNPIRTASLAACMARWRLWGLFFQYAGRVGQCSHGFSEKRGLPTSKSRRYRL